MDPSVPDSVFTVVDSAVTVTLVSTEPVCRTMFSVVLLAVSTLAFSTMLPLKPGESASTL